MKTDAPMNKHEVLFLVGVCGLTFQCNAVLSTVIIFQDRLNDRGIPVNVNYDLRFILHNVESSPTQVVTTLINSVLSVNKGLFGATFRLGTAFDSTAYWPETGVRTNDGSAFIAPQSTAAAHVRSERLFHRHFMQFPGYAASGGIQWHARKQSSSQMSPPFLSP
jgi:hypothetical protein